MNRNIICVAVVNLALILVVLTSTHSSGQTKDKFYRTAHPVMNSYIVVLEDFGVDSRGEYSIAPFAAQDLTAAYGGKVKQIYKDALQGFAVEMSEEAALKLSLDPRVKFVEEDGEVQATAVQMGATWGLDRIDQRDRPLNGQYGYNSTGTAVHVYVIDTGIRITHTQFGGRASADFDSIGDGQNGIDCNGHGTHVAGTIGGTTYGVAKSVTLHAVRVLNCTGDGTGSTVIAGVDWVTSHHQLPAVANMSLGGGASTAVDTAVRNSISSGVTYTISAGNDNVDACGSSPARVTQALTVGSSTFTDARSSFSNFGTCLDIFAPGSQITSAWLTSDTATNTISGTSMAAPHVAGVAALYLQNNTNASPATVATQIINTSTPNRLTGIGTGSPNKLLYSLLSLSGSGDAPCTNCTLYTGSLGHLDEVFLKINGRIHYLWRAVDQDGEVLDILVQRHRDKKAAKKFFRKLLKGIAVCTECDHYGQAKELQRGES